ncbi:hypothetical protein UAI_04384 [Enterococcus malodoratus ATCC 43197]|uniref:Uncharacterized protein n=1 Tax=Enterococcus malodoratus ATCC 43197 TaxID=1158601 RepID=R2QKA7_9ENTE|nr:hypothetical protein UAI_04384 [Enterococcus malodoratus ATCC 43197]EOT69876.1 hypothetical protein I585_01355 [Enterococcus malodoratus ATCC 43197]SPX01501.1 Uncharacterised protein [Enterococcus malodoratus]
MKRLLFATVVTAGLLVKKLSELLVNILKHMKPADHR